MACFRSMAGLILVKNVVGELRPKRTLAASRGFLAAARLSCLTHSIIFDRYIELRNSSNIILCLEGAFRPANESS